MTVAAGPVRFMEFAVDLALSIRETNQMPVALLTSPKGKSYIEGRYPGLFHTIACLPEAYLAHPLRANLGKLHMGEITPFDRTIFIDSDTIVTADIGGIWDRCDGLPMAMLGDHLALDSTWAHHTFTVQELIERFQLETYFKSASGVIYFEREKGRQVFKDCFTLYLEEFADDPHFAGERVQDELLFGVVAARHKMDILPPPRLLPWEKEVRRIKPGETTFPLLHWGAMPQETLQWQIQGIRRRRKDAGYRDASWLWKEMAERRAWKYRKPGMRFRLILLYRKISGNDPWQRRLEEDAGSA